MEKKLRSDKCAEDTVFNNGDGRCLRKGAGASEVGKEIEEWQSPGIILQGQSFMCICLCGYRNI